MSKYNRTQQSIAASDLLRALNTLKQTHEYQEELSFGYKPTEVPQPEKAMNFQIYMEKKAMKTTFKNQKSIKKSCTPLKQTTKYLNVKEAVAIPERKSLSPFQQRNTSIHRQTHNQTKKPHLSEKQNAFRNSSQNDKIDSSMSSSKLSCQTRKILNDKQKKGKVYVPIQRRAQQLLKERQMKLAKLQKEREMARMIEEKQCTFKPNISRAHYKPDQPSRKINKKADNWIKAEDIPAKPQSIEEQVVAEEQASNNEVIEAKAVNRSMDKSVQIAQETTESPAEPIKVTEGTVKKYKNEKFNKLLDFLL